MSEKTKQILKIILQVIVAAATAAITALGLSSCNVTRVVTTQSSCWQKGDTAITIQTRTTEMYDATKRTKEVVPSISNTIN